MRLFLERAVDDPDYFRINYNLIGRIHYQNDGHPVIKDLSEFLSTGIREIFSQKSFPGKEINEATFMKIIEHINHFRQ